MDTKQFDWSRIYFKMDQYNTGCLWEGLNLNWFSNASAALNNHEHSIIATIVIIIFMIIVMVMVVSSIMITVMFIIRIMALEMFMIMTS